MLWVVCVHHRWCFRGHKGLAPHRIFNCGGSTGEGTVGGVFLPGFFVVLFFFKQGMAMCEQVHEGLRSESRMGIWRE